MNVNEDSTKNDSLLLIVSDSTFVDSSFVYLTNCDTTINYSLVSSLDVSGSMVFDKLFDIGKSFNYLLFSNVDTTKNQMAYVAFDVTPLTLCGITQSLYSIDSTITSTNSGNGNDFVAQFLDSTGGLISLSKSGQNKRIIILETDAAWGPIPTSDLTNIITQCKKYGISVYIIVFAQSLYPSDEKTIIPSFQMICDSTNGILFDSVVKGGDEDSVLNSIKQRLLYYHPCSLAFTLPFSCSLYEKVILEDQKTQVSDTLFFRNMAFEPRTIKNISIEKKDTVITNECNVLEIPIIVRDNYNCPLQDTITNISLVNDSVSFVSLINKKIVWNDSDELFLYFNSPKIGFHYDTLEMKVDGIDTNFSFIVNDTSALDNFTFNEKNTLSYYDTTWSHVMCNSSDKYFSFKNESCGPEIVKFLKNSNNSFSFPVDTLDTLFRTGDIELIPCVLSSKNFGIDSSLAKFEITFQDGNKDTLTLHLRDSLFICPQFFKRNDTIIRGIVQCSEIVDSLKFNNPFCFPILINGDSVLSNSSLIISSVVDKPDTQLLALSYHVLDTTLYQNVILVDTEILSPSLLNIKFNDFNDTITKCDSESTFINFFNPGCKPIKIDSILIANTKFTVRVDTFSVSPRESYNDTIIFTPNDNPNSDSTLVTIFSNDTIISHKFICYVTPFSVKRINSSISDLNNNFKIDYFCPDTLYLDVLTLQLKLSSEDGIFSSFLPNLDSCSYTLFDSLLTIQLTTLTGDTILPNTILFSVFGSFYLGVSDSLTIFPSVFSFNDSVYNACREEILPPAPITIGYISDCGTFLLKQLITNGTLAFSVVPDPASNTIMFKSKNNLLISVYNAQGEFMLKVATNQNLDVRELHSGIYYAISNSHSVCFVIQR